MWERDNSNENPGDGMAAAERTKFKGTSTLYNNTSVNKISSQLHLLKEKSVGSDHVWKTRKRIS